MAASSSAKKRRRYAVDPVSLVSQISTTDEQAGNFLRLAQTDPTQYLALDWKEGLNLADPSLCDVVRERYFACEVLSKYPFFRIDLDRKQVAMDGFFESEDACSSTNLRLQEYIDRGGTNLSPRLWQVIQLARVKIERCLGRVDLNDVDRFMRHGPGATFDLKRTRGDSYHKFGVLTPTVTKASSVLGACAIACRPRWATIVGAYDVPGILECMKIVPGNRVITVPKNAKTDRTIAIEPMMNMYIQLGIGTVIRRKLRKAGVNLNSQERNQRLAREGSVTKSLATIDMKRASDSIAINAVRILLPSEWSDLLMMTRSPFGVLPDGRMLRYEKIASMGNGWCFELESLLFWALASAATESVRVLDRRLGVYGDDVILPVEAVPLFLELLSFFGFAINPKKSFWDGGFRESCGMHFYHGADVTPIYFKDRIDTKERLFWTCNSLSRVASRWGNGVYRHSAFWAPFLSTLERLPPSLRRPRIPDGFGDGGIAGSLDEACPRRHRYYDCWEVSHYVPKTRKLHLEGWPAFLRVMQKETKTGWTDLTQEILGEQRGSILQTSLSDTRLTKSFVVQWGGFGPWWDPVKDRQEESPISAS